MGSDKYTNEMIAEWVGFKERFTPGNLSYWWELSSYPFAQCPDFISSEADCFRFIIPKLREEGYGIDISIGRVGVFVNIWDLDKKHDDNLMNGMGIGVDTNVANALCMAVLEIIKKEPADNISDIWYA